MRRAIAALGAIVALVAAPAAAQACELSDVGERYEARSALAFTGDDLEIRRTTVVLCDRRSGRERVLRRGRLDPEAASGVGYHGGAAAGRRLVWVEERRWRGRARVVLVEARATDGSVFRRRELARNRDGFEPGELDAVVTAGGTVATFVPAGDQRVVVRRGGRELRELDRGSFGYLGLEDEYTVRWTVISNGLAERRYHDLLPPPRGEAGCPRRGRFQRILLTDAVEVTEAVYSRELTDTRTMRACLRSLGIDRVLAHGEESYGDGVALGLPLLDGDWAAVPRFGLNRYDGCTGVSIASTNLRTGARAPVGLGSGCRSPQAGEPVAITDAGVLGYVDQEDDAWTVSAFAPGGTRLDSGSPGAITGLRAEGSVLRWENAGQPRSAEVQPTP